MIDLVEALQWPAMVTTIAAAWLVGSSSMRRRRVGFWVFLCSNALWVGWGWHDGAYALIVLQVVLAVMNIRGAAKADQTMTPDQRGEAVGSDPTERPPSVAADVVAS